MSRATLQSLSGRNVRLWPEGGLAVPAEAQYQAGGDSAFSVRFLGGFISLMQSICICWFCHLSDVSDLFVLNYITGWNVIVVEVFLYHWVAANHSYMLQRIYNCLVLCICVLIALGKFYGEEYAWFKIYNDVTGTFSSILPIFKVVFSLNFSALTSLFFLAVGHNSLLAPYTFSASRLHFIYCLYIIFLEIICRTNNLGGLFPVE